MSAENIEKALLLIESVDISTVPSRPRLDEGPPRFFPDTEEDQAVVIGPQVQGYTKGVDEASRRMALNAMLLAQLAADKYADDDEWFGEYFRVLTATGFVTTDHQSTRTTNSSEQGDMDKSILGIAASLLGGPGASAYLVVKAALEALESLGEDDRTFRVFTDQRHEERHRFLFTSIEPNTSHLNASLIAVSFKAAIQRDQILFSRTKVTSAEVAVETAKLILNKEVMEGVAPAVRDKVRNYVQDFVRQLDIAV